MTKIFHFFFFFNISNCYEDWVHGKTLYALKHKGKQNEIGGYLWKKCVKQTNSWKVEPCSITTLESSNTFGSKGELKICWRQVVYIFYSPKLALPFPPRVQECPEISQSSQKWSPSGFMVIRSRVRAMLPRASSFLPLKARISSRARGQFRRAREACSVSESIDGYFKLGERGGVTFNHRERNVSGAIGFQNKRPICCWSWINFDRLKRIGNK